MASKNVIFGVNSWHRFMSAKRFFAASGRGKQRMLFLWMGFGEDECI